MRSGKKHLYWLVLPIVFVACTPQQPAAPATPPPVPGPTAKPYGTVLQIMRAIPFPNSNVIFDAQSNDPEAKKVAAKAAAEKAGPDGDPYAGTYGGWAGVEESALALSETANLLLIPGRKCSNGLDAPVDRDDWKKFVQGLADAGLAAQKAAQSKNPDSIVDVSGAVSDACQMCHDVYRDQPEPKQRCTP